MNWYISLFPGRKFATLEQPFPSLDEAMRWVRAHVFQPRNPYMNFEWRIQTADDGSADFASLDVIPDRELTDEEIDAADTDQRTKKFWKTAPRAMTPNYAWAEDEVIFKDFGVVETIHISRADRFEACALQRKDEGNEPEASRDLALVRR